MKHFKKIIALLCMISLMVPAYSFGAYADTPQEGTITGTVTRYIYFGSYPQTEIVSKASQSGVYNREWATTDDYIVNSDLYIDLEWAKWDANGDVTIDGAKYHRIEKYDATDSEHNFPSDYYKWSDSTTYHYFKYEPIKWRILEKDDDDAFLLADIALDDQKYNSKDKSVTWETCTLRNWLNNEFISRAFTADEQKAINTTDVVNNDNIEYGTNGGNNTQDKVFLLSESEVYTDNAKKYGFNSSDDAFDKERRAKSSTYAKAMGSFSNYLGNCDWWLRSPGDDSRSAACVDFDGFVHSYGGVDRSYTAIRPALHLNLKSSNLYETDTTYVEIKAANIKLSSTAFNYDGTAKKPKVSISGVPSKNYDVTYVNNVEPGTAKAIITGKGTLSGTISKTFTIKPILSVSKVKISLGSKSNAFTGKNVRPKVKIAGYEAGKDFTVKYPSKSSKMGTYTLIVKGKNALKGSQKVTYKVVKPYVSCPTKFKTQKIAINKVKLSWEKATGATGYQISKSSKKSGTKVVAKIKGKTKKIKATGEYYYKVRSYKKVAGKTFYSKWTKAKACNPASNSIKVYGGSIYDDEYGGPGVHPRRVYYNSNGKVVLKTTIYNNRIFRALKFDWIKLTVWYGGKVIATKKFKNVPLNIGAGNCKTVYFTFDGKATRRYVDLQKASEVEYEYDYWYTYQY